MIRAATLDDIEKWAVLRYALWPSATIDEHRAELLAVLQTGAHDFVGFLAIDEDTRVHGFAEATLRNEHVNGCETTPVAFLEGIYVCQEARGGGIGRALNAAVEGWARERGCYELASDALVENTGSQRFHRAVGFEETERVIYFRKRI